jgi:hypothetical protein
MPNPFTEDALIEQPAIRLFMDVLGRPSTNKNHLQARMMIKKIKASSHD